MTKQRAKAGAGRRSITELAVGLALLLLGSRWRFALVCASILCVLAGSPPAGGQDLPPAIQADRFLLEAERQISNGEFAAALEVLNEAERLVEESEIYELPWADEAERAVPTREATGAPGQEILYVGIQSMYFRPSAQRNSQWCWAASIQMVLNHWGVNIDQADIVARSYGTNLYGMLPDWTESLPVIAANLNNWSVDRSGQVYSVGAQYGRGPPGAPRLMEELEQGNPVIVGYTPPGASVGHAVVVTAAGYSLLADGRPVLLSIVVRDPWPSPENVNSSGRNEYSAREFLSSVNAHWSVRVSPLESARTGR